MTERQKKYYEENKDKIKLIQKRYRSTDEYKDYQKQYVDKNRVKINQQKKEYYERNRKKIIEDILKKRIKPVKPVKPVKPIVTKAAVQQPVIQKIKDTLYMKNNQLLYQIILSSGLGYRTKKLDQMLITIASKLVTKFTPPLSESKGDYIHTAYINMVLGLKSYDKMKNENAFAYMTEICKRAFTKEYNIMIDSGYGKAYQRDFSYVHSYGNI